MAIIVAIIDNAAVIGRRVTILADLDSTRLEIGAQVLAAPPDLIANDDRDGDTGHAPLNLAAFPLVRFRSGRSCTRCRRQTFRRIELNRAGLNDRATCRARKRDFADLWSRARREARQQQRARRIFVRPCVVIALSIVKCRVFDGRV